MPYAIPTLDGQPIFGLVTRSTATRKPPDRQRDAFAGINGELDKFLGTRGWMFTIEGVFEEGDIGSIQNDFGIIDSFVGPGTHTYVDTKGNQFPNVVYNGQMTPDPNGPHPSANGWAQAYSMQFESLL